MRPERIHPPRSQVWQVALVGSRLHRAGVKAGLACAAGWRAWASPALPMTAIAAVPLLSPYQSDVMSHQSCTNLDSVLFSASLGLRVLL